MIDFCQCKLPYVNKGESTCTRCKKMQPMFLPVLAVKSVSVKREWKGIEFKSGDIVEVIGKSYACLVEIDCYLGGGWYRVKIPNGCYHETQILGDIVNSKTHAE